MAATCDLRVRLAGDGRISRAFAPRWRPVHGWAVVFVLFFLFRGSIALGMVVSTAVYCLLKGITLQEVVETMVIGFDNQFIYSMLSGASLGNLFLGGVVPGLAMGLAMMGYIAAAARKRGYPVGRWQGFRGLSRVLCRAFLSLMTPVILLGGIYSGVFTPTEAGAAAALYALILAAMVYRELGMRGLFRELVATVENVGFLSLDGP